MAITTNAAIAEEAGATTHISDASAITAGSFNAGTITALTLTDNVKLADAVLDVTMAVAPVAGDAFHLYRRDMNISGAGNHAPVPSPTYKSIYVGSFKLALVTNQPPIPLPAIPISKDQEFYLENDSGQSTSGTTVLTINPWTYNAKV